jgi:CBS-domain-containing membrane protein
MTAVEVTVRDIMVDVFAFPHIPYWFTIRQAVGILKNSLLKDATAVHPPVVLVFDERYNLVGTIALADLLRGMGPLFAEGADASAAAGTGEDWRARPVSGLMTPAKAFVEPDATLAEAARALAGGGLALLPVLENRKKLVGVVRARELFREFAALL